MTIYSFSSISTVIICSAMGCFVLLRRQSSSSVKIYYTLMQFSVAWWAGALYLQDNASDSATALLWCRINHIGSGLIACAFYLFIVNLLGERERLRKVNIAVVLLWALISLLNFTHYSIPSVSARREIVNYFNDPGPMYMLFLLYFFGVSSVAMFLMWRKYHDLPEQIRKQIIFVFVASAFGVIGGGTTFLVVYKVYVPIIVNFGIFGVTTFNIFFTYAIFKHHLLDIEVILKKTVVFSGLLGFVYIVFSVVTYIVSSIIPGGRHWALFLCLIFITVAYDPLRGLLTTVTNKFLFQKKVNYQTFLRNFSSSLITIVDLNRIAHLVARTISDVYNLSGASMMLYNRHLNSYYIAASVDNAVKDNILRMDNPLVLFFSDNPKIIRRNNLDDFELIGVLRELKSEMCIPLVFKGKLLGMLNLGSKKSDQEYTGEDEDNFLTLESQISVAVNNAILFKAQEEAHILLAQKNKMDAIIALSSGINHEINNPLSIISMRCQNFLRKLSSGKFITASEIVKSAQEVIESCVRNANRAHMITKRLANFAKPVQEEFNLQPLNIKGCIQECIDLIGKKQFFTDNIVMNIEISDTMRDIYADRIHFQQVLYNMMMNAYHAIEKNGTITFKAYEKGSNKIVLEINDTGIGISKENLDKIWEPFFTTKPTNPLPGKKATGSGLGLALVKRYIENSGGSIEVDSTEGKGTTFYLYLLKVKKEEA